MLSSQFSRIQSKTYIVFSLWIDLKSFEEKKNTEILEIMKEPLLLIIVFLIQCFYSFGQFSNNIGIQYEIGSKSNFNIGENYNQYISTVQRNFFFSTYKKDNKVSNRWILGSRSDFINFENYAKFLSDNGETIDHFNTNDNIVRNALKAGYLRQRHFGKDYYQFIFTFNYGIFYEMTTQAKRISSVPEQNYQLSDEIKTSGFIFTTGVEVSYRFITLGCKEEKWLTDVLDHKYINKLPKSPLNSSAMQGLRLDSWMPFIYFGLKIDI